MPSIEVSTLTKRFGVVEAVAGLSATVADGSFTTLLGPSGCGKTTTLRLLAGLERPDAGEIVIGERVVASVGEGVFLPVEKRQVGVVFQSYALWPHMKVFDPVAYPLQVRRTTKGETRAAVMRALDLVQLADYAYRYPSELSGGQQQRVALARAPVFGPTVLFLDEPLSNLDAALRADMREELARLHHETGVTTVYVTHDQAEALALSDQILLMRDSKVVERGTPETVDQRPTTAYGARFVGSANCLGGTVVRSSGNSVTVKLGNGDEVEAVSDGPTAVRPGMSVVVVVRPEVLRPISGSNGAHRNTIRGRVEQRTFVGSHIEMVVLIGGERVRVLAPNDASASAGGDLSLQIPQGSARVLRGEADTANGHHGADTEEEADSFD